MTDTAKRTFIYFYTKKPTKYIKNKTTQMQVTERQLKPVIYHTCIELTHALKCSRTSAGFISSVPHITNLTDYRPCYTCTRNSRTFGYRLLKHIL